jgi:hypothetical protein
METRQAMLALRSRALFGGPVSSAAVKPIAAAAALTLVLFATEGQARDLGPVGGAGGGEFRIACEPGDSVVGFDVMATHVIARIAPVCGNRKEGGTYGRPWIGSDVAGATLYKPRCEPGSILTILHVFWDRTPLINNLGFTCWNPKTGTTNDVLPTFGGDTQVNQKRLRCKNREAGTGIVGRAGTAIDALGVTCSPT